MKIHPVFHVSHLKLVNTSNVFPSQPFADNRPPAELLDDTKEEVYVVERIVNKRATRGKVHYLVKWEGYPDWEMTRKPESAFKLHRDAIDTYEQEQRQRTHTMISNTSDTDTRKQPRTSTPNMSLTQTSNTQTPASMTRVQTRRQRLRDRP